MPICAMLLLGAALAAGSDPHTIIAPAFAGTIVSTYPDGRTGKLWLNADGSYTAEGRRHDSSRGHWKLNGQKLCLSQSRPIPSPFSYCTAVPEHGVHGSWTGKAVTGEAIRIRLTQGR